MLKLAKKMSEISIGSLMEVYAQSCLEQGRARYPQEDDTRQIAAGEREFYTYLTQVFFRTEGVRLAIWEEDGRYVSALRLEPYQDGLLLAGLETAPNQRRKGYAVKLVKAVLAELEGVKIYSHISVKNQASIRTHEVCGFFQSREYSVLLDGTVSRRYMTYCRIA